MSHYFANYLKIITTKDKIVAAVTTFQSCQILSVTITDHCAVFFHLKAELRLSTGKCLCAHLQIAVAHREELHIKWADWLMSSILEEGSKQKGKEDDREKKRKEKEDGETTEETSRRGLKI